MKERRVIFADAYMTNRTLNLVYHIFTARAGKAKAIYSSWCQYPHKAYRVGDKKQSALVC